MPDIEHVLERLVTDQDFREALQRDPATALASYELTEDEQAVLAAQLDTEVGESGHVEQRTSKSSTMALLSSMDGVLEGGSPQAAVGGADSPAETSPVEDGTEQTDGVTLKQFQELSGDADRPIILGSVPNPPAPAGADYHQVKMEDVLISSYQAGTGDEAPTDATAPTEEVSLTFEKVEWPWEADADPGGPTDLVAPDEPEELILPAVQKVREASASLEGEADVQIKNAPGSEPPQETDLEFLRSRAGEPSSNKESIARFEVEPEELILPAVQAARETPPPPTGD